MNAITTSDPGTVLRRLREDIAAGRIIPYLGPDVLALETETPAVPIATRALADRLNAKVACPGRIRGNMWSVAQYIESRRHRVTLVRLMKEIFGPAVAPTALHHWLAGLPDLPLIIDTWYDGTMASALKQARAAGQWGQVQGVTRNGEWKEIWRKTFTADGTEVEEEAAADWGTVLYKPHGSVAPAENYLVSDSDYVEVLTEIDIQSPLPPLVKTLRESRGFVFLGCRFYDQMLRTYARQIMKRSEGPYFAVVGGQDLTKNEQKFFAEQNIVPLDITLADAAAILVGQPA